MEESLRLEYWRVERLEYKTDGEIDLAEQPGDPK